jgi:putative hydrolase of the HAD superfamily
VMAELGIAASDLVFIDNKSVNVDGAIAVGGAGHVFTDAAALESWLRELAA